MTIFRKVKGLSVNQLVAFGCHVGGLCKYDRGLMLYVVGTRSRKLLYNLNYMFFFMKNITSILNCSVLNYYDDILFINCNMSYAHTFMMQCITLDVPYLYTKWTGGAVSNMKCLGRGGVNFKKYKLEGIWGMLFPPGVVFNISGVYNKLSFKETRSVDCLTIGLMDLDDDFDVDYQNIKAYKYGYIDFPAMMNDDGASSLGYMMYVASCVILVRRAFIRTYYPWQYDEEELSRTSGSHILRVLLHRAHGAHYHYYQFVRRNPRQKKRLERYYTFTTAHGYFRIGALVSNLGRIVLKTAVHRNYWYPFLKAKDDVAFTLIRVLLCMWYQHGPVDRDTSWRRIKFRMLVKYHIKITYIMYRQFMDGYGRRVESASLIMSYYWLRKHRRNVRYLLERHVQCAPLVSTIIRYRLYYVFHPKNTGRSFMRNMKLAVSYFRAITYHNRRKALKKTINTFYYHYYSTRSRVLRQNYLEGQRSFYKYTWTRREVYTMYNFVFDRIDPDFPEFTLLFDYWELDEEPDVDEPNGDERYYYQVYEKEMQLPVYFYEYRYYFTWLWDGLRQRSYDYGSYAISECNTYRLS